MTTRDPPANDSIFAKLDLVKAHLVRTGEIWKLISLQISHQKNRLNKPVFVCSFCEAYFKKTIRLYLHIIESHSTNCHKWLQELDSSKVDSNKVREWKADIDLVVKQLQKLGNDASEESDRIWVLPNLNQDKNRPLVPDLSSNAQAPPQTKEGSDVQGIDTSSMSNPANSARRTYRPGYPRGRRASTVHPKHHSRGGFHEAPSKRELSLSRLRRKRWTQKQFIKNGGINMLLGDSRSNHLCINLEPIPAPNFNNTVISTEPHKIIQVDQPFLDGSKEPQIEGTDILSKDKKEISARKRILQHSGFVQLVDMLRQKLTNQIPNKTTDRNPGQVPEEIIINGSSQSGSIPQNVPRHSISMNDDHIPSHELNQLNSPADQQDFQTNFKGNQSFMPRTHLNQSSFPLTQPHGFTRRNPQNPESVSERLPAGYPGSRRPQRESGYMQTWQEIYIKEIESSDEVQECIAQQSHDEAALESQMQAKKAIQQNIHRAVEMTMSQNPEILAQISRNRLFPEREQPDNNS